MAFFFLVNRQGEKLALSIPSFFFFSFLFRSRNGGSFKVFNIRQEDSGTFLLFSFSFSLSGSVEDIGLTC